MTDPSAVAATARGVARVGIAIRLQRVSGQAPRTATFSAEITAIVRDFLPDTQAPERAGYGSTQRGGITQGDRQIIVMVQDLVDKRFPLPVRKGDRIIIVRSGEGMTVTRADPYKRTMAGAIELFATGAG